ncbi:MAG: MFS transporter [Chloroflexota bacterium]
MSEKAPIYQPSIKQKVLRHLLALDQPITILNATEAMAAQARNFRWNFFFNAIDVTFFMGAISLLSATTILPLFVSKLSDSTIPITIVAMLAQGGFLLPQILSANFIEQLDHKKPVVVNLGFLTERLPAILLVLAPLAAFWSPFAALILFLVLYAWFLLGGGVVTPAWQDMVARCFPVQWRGRFFGSTMFLGTLYGIGIATAGGIILDSVLFPLNFAILFGIAGLSIIVSWFFLAQVREPIEAVNVPERSTRQYLAELPALLKADHNFRNYLIARFVMALAEMGSGYLTVAALQVWAISDSLVAAFTTATLLGQTCASLLMGFLADRYGHRLSLEIACFSSALAFGIAWLAPDPTWYLAVFFLLGVFMGARIVSGMMVVLEFCTPEKRPTYVGIANTLSGIGSIIAPLIGAALLIGGYSWSFVGSLLASVVALFLFRFLVIEPRFA